MATYSKARCDQLFEKDGTSKRTGEMIGIVSIIARGTAACGV